MKHVFVSSFTDSCDLSLRVIEHLSLSKENCVFLSNRHQASLLQADGYTAVPLTGLWWDRTKWLQADGNTLTFQAVAESKKKLTNILDVVGTSDFVVYTTITNPIGMGLLLDRPGCRGFYSIETAVVDKVKVTGVETNPLTEQYDWLVKNNLHGIFSLKLSSFAFFHEKFLGLFCTTDKVRPKEFKPLPCLPVTRVAGSKRLLLSLGEVPMFFNTSMEAVAFWSENVLTADLLDEFDKLEFICSGQDCDPSGEFDTVSNIFESLVDVRSRNITRRQGAVPETLLRREGGAILCLRDNRLPYFAQYAQVISALPLLVKNVPDVGKDAETYRFYLDAATHNVRCLF